MIALIATDMPMGWAVAVFVISAAVIGIVGTRLTAVCDRLADRTGLGEAFTGGVFLGAATSLPGITASVTAAIDGLPSLAMSNAVGGIAAQTVFLAIADMTYRRANLEHAAASVENMMQAALLIVLLALILVGMLAPPLELLGVHPLTLVLFAAYLYGMWMVFRSRGEPMWRPRMTRQTRVDEPDEAPHKGPGLRQIWLIFAVTAAAVVIAGVAATRSAESIAVHTGLTESVVGMIMTAVATSLPELVTSIAAVRRGALTLAVGGVVGGNAFDTLFAAVADIAYRPGSIYHAATSRETILVALTALMTAVLLMGLIRRQRSGIAGIGFESFFIVVFYALGVAIITLT